MIVEKIFAKFMGSYANAEGGYIAFALQAITGCPVHKFEFSAAKRVWRKYYMKLTSPVTQLDANFTSVGDTMQSDEVYELFSRLLDEGCIMGAGTNGQDNTLTDGRGDGGGIVPGHAYTILKVFDLLVNQSYQ